MAILRMVKYWLCSLLLSALVCGSVAADVGEIAFGQLPKEAQQTVILIKRGGPFPYEKDGAVFGNYEAQLPRKSRGYYHEYTVQKAKARSRGAKRIVTGGNGASLELYYTSDHYRSFRKIKEESQVMTMHRH